MVDWALVTGPSEDDGEVTGDEPIWDPAGHLSGPMLMTPELAPRSGVTYMHTARTKSPLEEYGTRWKDRNGVVWKVEDMDLVHARNVLAFLERRDGPKVDGTILGEALRERIARG